MFRDLHLNPMALSKVAQNKTKPNSWLLIIEPLLCSKHYGWLSHVRQDLCLHRDSCWAILGNALPGACARLLSLRLTQALGRQLVRWQHLVKGVLVSSLLSWPIKQGSASLRNGKWASVIVLNYLPPPHPKEEKLLIWLLQLGEGNKPALLNPRFFFLPVRCFSVQACLAETDL